ncbi:GNAT family N-acetyltransferase [Clostridium sp.]|uniref:GNAT family N-acetyltransferase n=1 Tax=Clostridium sp. TaxID=1506 RepID=UPI002585BB9A|nr:GNAT family N-acetyltransferase [Clostridium sp.]
MMIIRENILTANQFNMLFNSVGWDSPSEEQTQTALKNSLCTFAIYEEDNLVGMARLLGDNAMSYYVKDFVILPEYQGNGLGKVLMNHMISFIKQQLPKGYKVSLELIRSKGKEPFYSKFGFEERPCQWGGAGMFMMVEA